MRVMWLAACFPVALLTGAPLDAMTELPRPIATATSSRTNAPVTLGFDGVPDLSLQINDFGVQFTGAQVLACGASLNCGPFPPFSGKNVIYDAPNLGSGVITAVFDVRVTGRVDKVSARITGNRNVTMLAMSASGVVLGTAQTGGPNYVGSGTGLPANILLEIESTTDPIAMVVFHDSGNTYTIDDFAFRSSQQMVVLDPGHGQILQEGVLEYQRPATPTYGLFEDNLTLDMAFATKSQLEAANITVQMTRTTTLAPFAPADCPVPCFADLNKRARWIEKQEPDLMVSIHTNAGSPTAHGSESYYSTLAPNPDSQTLAQFVLSRVAGLALTNRGVKQENFNILSTPTVPSTLIEVAFHSNSQLAPGQSITDESLLNDPGFRFLAGVAISNAIRDYYASK
jgi:N-acetylmuramoyl-L-alanine amidase